MCNTCAAPTLWPYRPCGLEQCPAYRLALRVHEVRHVHIELLLLSWLAGEVLRIAPAINPPAQPAVVPVRGQGKAGEQEEEASELAQQLCEQEEELSKGAHGWDQELWRAREEEHQPWAPDEEVGQPDKDGYYSFTVNKQDRASVQCRI